MNGIMNLLQSARNFVGLLMRSMFNLKGLVSIAMVSMLVAAASQSSGVAGDFLGALSAAILAGFGLGIMRQQATSDTAGLPQFNLKNLLRFLTDGTIAIALKSGLTLGLTLAGGVLAGIPGALIGLIYSQLALVHYAASVETLPKAENIGDQISRGTKAISSVVDLPTIIGTIFAKPLNTIAALAVTIGSASVVGAAASAAPILVALATVVALVTNAHVWSKVYRSANCASDCHSS